MEVRKFVDKYRLKIHSQVLWAPVEEIHFPHKHVIIHCKDLRPVILNLLRGRSGKELSVCIKKEQT